MFETATPTVPGVKVTQRPSRPADRSAVHGDPEELTAAPAGPVTSLYIGMCALILLVVACIVAAGITGAVWVLVIGVAVLFVTLGLMLVGLMRFID